MTKPSDKEPVCCVTGFENPVTHLISLQPAHAGLYWNQIPLCTRLDLYTRQVGILALMRRHPAVEGHLRQRGWIIVDRKWKHPEVAS
jgi:hypothetical protein